MLCLLLAALAVPLSQTSPRQGRYLRLGFGLVVYIVFTNLISIGKSWITTGKMAPEFGLWWVHLLMFALLVFLLMQQTGFRYLLQRAKTR
jgi:lipopolysaccharide export system permease protein